METEWELTREPNSNVFGMMRIVPETQQTTTIILQFGLLSRCIVPKSDAYQISTTSPLTSGTAPILLAPRKYESSDSHNSGSAFSLVADGRRSRSVVDLGVKVIKFWKLGHVLSAIYRAWLKGGG